MAVFRCVTGDIPVSEMGFCQPHEHIYVGAGPGTKVFPALLADDIDKSAREVEYYSNAGGNTLIDAQPFGAGGNYTALKTISLATLVNIVATCGFHMPFFYRPDDDILTLDEGALYERFLSELNMAGAVKTAIGKDGLTGDLLPRFRAAGRAAAKANVPVLMHTEFGFGAVEAVKLLEALGVNPRKVLVCHADRQAEDYEIHERIAQTGAVLEYDTIARFKYHDDESEVRLISHMLSKGYNLTLSLDTTSQRMKSYSGQIGLGYIIEVFIPLMLKRGISKADIDQMTKYTPASVFE